MSSEVVLLLLLPWLTVLNWRRKLQSVRNFPRLVFYLWRSHAGHLVTLTWFEIGELEGKRNRRNCDGGNILKCAICGFNLIALVAASLRAIPHLFPFHYLIQQLVGLLMVMLVTLQVLLVVVVRAVMLLLLVLVVVLGLMILKVVILAL